MKKSIRNHLIFWGIYFVYCYVTDIVSGEDPPFLFEAILFLTHNIYLFYLLAFCLQKISLKSKKPRALGIAYFLVVIAGFVIIRYTDYLFVFPTLLDPKYENFESSYMMMRTLIWVVTYFFYAAAYVYYISSKQKQEALMAMTKDQMRKDQERLELENTLLKAQINPHFLYNSLNFLYAKSLPLSNELSNGIIKLSDIMRYSLQPHDVDGLVLLGDEVEHIKNVIEMAQLRFSNGVYLEFNCEGNIAGIKIIPLALITLVENVLKHGVISDQNMPAKLHLLITEKGILHFTTWNRKRIGLKELSTGIGLNNTLKRLQNAYNKDCAVKISDGNDDFGVDLTIDFKLTPTTDNVC